MKAFTLNATRKIDNELETTKQSESDSQDNKEPHAIKQGLQKVPIAVSGFPHKSWTRAHFRDLTF
jgi:hypothetical protein